MNRKGQVPIEGSKMEGGLVAGLERKPNWRQNLEDRVSGFQRLGSGSLALISALSSQISRQ